MVGSLAPFVSVYLKKWKVFCFSAFFRNPPLDVILIYLHCYFNDIVLRGHGRFPFWAWPPYEVPSVIMPELFLTTASLKYTPSWEEDQKFAWVGASSDWGLTTGAATPMASSPVPNNCGGGVPRILQGCVSNHAVFLKMEVCKVALGVSLRSVSLLINV